MTALEQRFERDRGTLEQIARHFHKRRGGDLEEITSEVYYRYVRDHLKEGRETNHQTLWRDLWSDLADEFNGTNWVSLKEEVQDTTTDLQGFFMDLSDDAKEVVRIVLNSAKIKRQVEKRSKRQRLLNLLKKTLAGMGWTAGRIAESVSEIMEALQ